MLVTRCPLRCPYLTTYTLNYCNSTCDALVVPLVMTKLFCCTPPRVFCAAPSCHAHSRAAQLVRSRATWRGSSGSRW